MNQKVVIRALGRVLGILAISMLIPLGLSYVFGENVHYHFFIPIILLGVLSLLSFLQPGSITSLNLRESMLMVTVTWLSVSFFGALPFLFDHVFTSFTDAFFETLSGFTATGSTVLTNIEAVPRSLLFWRSETHWLGGMGIVVLAIAIFPSLQGKKALFDSESPVSVTEEKLSPRITTVAKSYWRVYVLFTLVEALLLLPAMGWFDAVTHAFSTIAGGGFSTRNDSIAYFNSVYVEVVVMIFMIAGATSFILHYNALKGKFQYLKSTSFKIFISVVFIAIGLVTVNLYMVHQHDMTMATALRRASFQVVSIITTTGFANADFKIWPSFSVLILILLMFIGGMSGSTSGSVKVWRYEIIFKDIRQTFHRILRHRIVEHVVSNRRIIAQGLLMKVQIFIVAYIFIFILSGLALMAFGYSGATSFSAVAATLGNVGPGIGAVGPFDNFAFFPTVPKWILSLDMLLGRLEIWTVLSLFVPEFWGY